MSLHSWLVDAIKAQAGNSYVRGAEQGAYFIYFLVFVIVIVIYFWYDIRKEERKEQKEKTLPT